MPSQHYLKHKTLARQTITNQAKFFASLYGVTLKRIAIKNTRSRWGSCSKLGNLNFSYKIVFLPKELMDYVIVHEICHLIEFNHSPRFWAQVAHTMSNYRQLQKQIQKYNLISLK